MSENQINLIETTSPQVYNDRTREEFGKTGTSHLLLVSTNACGNVSETSSLVIRGDLICAASGERIEMVCKSDEIISSSE